MNIKLLAAGGVFALALSACGSSGSSTVPAARGLSPSIPVASVPPSSGGSAASAQRSTMRISISIPAKTKISGDKRRTKTVSPQTAYVDVVLTSLGGDPQPVTGPYSSLIPVSQLGACGGGGGGRAHGRAPQSVSGCFTVSVPAPVGNAVYAVGAVDANMTLLDYVDSVPVTVTSSGTATLTATLNGVGASVIGYTMLTDPQHSTPYKTQNAVDCPGSAVHYEPKAVCAFVFDVADAGADDMATGAVAGRGHLANLLSFTVTDLTTQTLLNIGYGASLPSSANPVYEIDFNPANPQGGLAGTTLGAGQLGTYNAVIHPDLTAVPSNATDTVEFKAVVQPAATTAFGPNVLLPQSAPATFTWDLTCKNVTVPPNDPSGVAEGSVFQYCLPQESNLSLVVQ